MKISVRTRRTEKQGRSSVGHTRRRYEGFRVETPNGYAQGTERNLTAKVFPTPSKIRKEDDEIVFTCIARRNKRNTTTHLCVLNFTLSGFGLWV